MYNLFDVSMTIYFGEVVDGNEAIQVLFENDMQAGIMCGYDSGEYFEERVECPALMTRFSENEIAVCVTQSLDIDDEESRYEELDIIEENDALADKNDFIDWLFNERRGDALKLYAQYARTITKEG